MAPQATTNSDPSAASSSSSPSPSSSASPSSSSPSPASQDFGFLPRVTSHPMIHSALGAAKNYYDVTKTRYDLVGKLEQGLVQNLVPTVLENTPQTAHVAISRGLHQLDHYACSGLEVLERHVVILDSGKKFLDERVVSPVSGAVGKASTQLTHLRNTSSNDLQKLAGSSKEGIHYVITTAEGHVAQIRQSAGELLKKEDAQIRKVVDRYAEELKNALHVALKKLEEMTPSTVKETTRTVLEGLSRSFSRFAEQVSLVSREIRDPLVKKALEAWKVSFELLSSYSFLFEKISFGRITLPKKQEKEEEKKEEEKKEEEKKEEEKEEKKEEEASTSAVVSEEIVEEETVEEEEVTVEEEEEPSE